MSKKGCQRKDVKESLSRQGSRSKDIDYNKDMLCQRKDVEERMSKQGYRGKDVEARMRSKDVEAKMSKQGC